MPTKRRRINRTALRQVSDALWELLATGDLPTVKGSGWFDAFLQHADYLELPGRSSGLRETWNTVRHEFLAEWIAERPGTRPAA